MSNFVKNLVTELPKSPLPAGYATKGDGFTFFVSGPKPLECDKYIIDGEAIVLSTGGNAAVHYGKGKFSYSTDCWALQPVENDIEGKYLYYFLSFQIDRIDALGFEGSGLKHLRKDFVRNYEVPDLSKPEQSKIAEVLSKVDQAIEQTESLIAKQQRIKTGLMQDLLTRGIDEHGNLRSEETHEFKDSPLGRIPAEWDFCCLNDCVPTFAPICYGILMPGYGHVGGVPIIKVKNIVGGRINQDDLLLTDPKIDSLYRRSRLQHGDLLLTIRGTTGRLAIVPSELEGANITQDTARIRLKDGYSNYFFYFLLQTQSLQDQIDLHTLGQAVKGINIAEVKRLHFGLPKKEEQFEIANRMIASQSLIDNSDYQLMKLRSLKNALMQDLLTGKKRVTPLMKNMEVCP